MDRYEIKGFIPPFEALRPVQWNIAERDSTGKIIQIIGPFPSKRSAKNWIKAEPHYV